jgi:hypothetical protein
VRVSFCSGLGVASAWWFAAGEKEIWEDSYATEEFSRVWQVFVHREEQVKLPRIGDESEQFSIFYARPARLWHGLNVVVR